MGQANMESEGDGTKTGSLRSAVPIALFQFRDGGKPVPRLIHNNLYWFTRHYAPGTPKMALFAHFWSRHSPNCAKCHKINTSYFP